MHVGSGLQAPGSSHRWPQLRNPTSETLERQLQECTLRVCGRKTTVAKYSVVKEPRSDRLLLFQELCGWLAFGDPPSRPISALQRVPLLRGLPTVAHARVRTRERRLENTGLEPVTSWLQTRRSPS